MLPVKAAKVFARLRKSGEVDVPDAIGDVGDGKDWAGLSAGRLEVSECADSGLPDADGTVKNCALLPEDAAPSVFSAGGVNCNSGGISSGGGIGNPRAAAISWCSVHDSEKSFSPRQKGARRLSIYIVLAVDCFTLMNCRRDNIP